MRFKDLLSLRAAGRIMLVGLALLAMIHLLVMLRLLPASIVWGGQLGDTGENLLLMEGSALVVTLLIMAAVVARLRIRRTGIMKKLSVIGMWIIFILFALSTIGNLTSSTTAETLIFTPLSIILALLALRIAIEN